jgi:hypothetical protein
MNKQEFLELLYNLILAADDMELSSQYGTPVRVIDKDHLLTLIHREISNYEEEDEDLRS